MEEEKNKFSGLKNLGLEIIAILIAVSVVILALNYYNIVSFSKMFPEYLGFLPSNTQEGNPRTTENALNLVAMGEVDTKEFIITNLQEEFLPDSYHARPLQTIDGKILDSNRITMYWFTQENLEIHASTRYSNEGEVEDKALLIINPTPITNLTEENASSAINNFLRIEYDGEWECINTNSDTGEGITCKINWLGENNTRKIVGVTSIIPGTTDKSSLFTCEIYPNSIFYDKAEFLCN